MQIYEWYENILQRDAASDFIPLNQKSSCRSVEFQNIHS